MNFLHLARVAAVHPEDHSVDIVMVDGSGRYPAVQVLAIGAGTNTGLVNMPAPTASADKWGLAEKTGNDALAVVGFLAPGVPIVLGMLYPQVNGMLFADGRKIDRHSSDVYSTVDAQGNAEWYHPSGTFVRVGASPAHEDLTGKDYDANWQISKNTGAAVHLVATVANAGAVKATLDIDPSGNITLTHQGNLTVNTTGTAHVTSGGNATVTAPHLEIEATSTHMTGTLTVEGLLTYKAGLSGSGGSGASMTGPITQSGGAVTLAGSSLTHNGKDVGSTHTHSGVQTGSGDTGAPN